MWSSSLLWEKGTTKLHIEIQLLTKQLHVIKNKHSRRRREKNVSLEMTASLWINCLFFSTKDPCKLYFLHINMKEFSKSSWSLMNAFLNYRHEPHKKFNTEYLAKAFVLNCLTSICFFDEVILNFISIDKLNQPWFISWEVCR